MPGKNKEKLVPTKLYREALIRLLDKGLSRKYQALIAYLNWSQVFKGAQSTESAKEHAGEALPNAITVAHQTDYLGRIPAGISQDIKTFDEAPNTARRPHNEQERVANYRIRGSPVRSSRNVVNRGAHPQNPY